MRRDILKKGINSTVALIFAFSSIVQTAPLKTDTLKADTLRPTSAGASGYGSEVKALAARLRGKLISERNHRGRDGEGGINKIARIEILANRTRDLKQGTIRGKLPPETTIDYDIPFLHDSFFQGQVLPLLKQKVKVLSNLNKLPTAQSKKISIENLWEEWTIRMISNWRKNCREENIPDDIIEHYGRERSLTLIDYNDYRYLKSLPDGDSLITALLFHGFAHIVVDRQGTGDMPEERIEDYIQDITDVIIEGVEDILGDTEEIDKYNEELNVSEQRRRLNKIRSTLKKISRTAEQSYSRTRYNTLLKNLQKVNLELNYMQVSPENEELFRKILKYRHNLAGRLSSVVLKHPDCLSQLREQADEDLCRYIDYAIAKGITSGDDGRESLKVATENIGRWFSPPNHIPEYIQQGLVRGKLEGRSEDIVYDYGGGIKSEGWKEFGTAGIRNEAVQSSFDIIRKLELEEFAKVTDDPRVAILTGPYLINSVSLIKQAMTIIKLINFIEHKIETGEWPQEVSEEERKGWPKQLSDKLIEDIGRKTITIAYDSRLNGRYFAYLLAAVFLENGFKINIFDNPAGVPGGVIVACGADFFGELAEGYDFNSIEGSIFGALVSASHSQAWYNGFKVFLGYQKSQVDKSMKEMLKNTMTKVDYRNMSLEKFANKSIEELEEFLERNSERLTWIGADKPREDFNYCGGRFVSFYPLYYEYLSKRSPLAHISGEELTKVIEARRALKILYTAFFGVGAKPATNLPGFFDREGYQNVDVVKKQTDEMDGRFPGHLMPDPGVVNGWMSNLWDYIEQIAGKELSGINEAINALNHIEAGIATDPDIDRTGMMLGLPKDIEGNIKKDFIEWVEEYIDKNFGKETERIKSKVIPALKKLKDKLLLPANDAWTFMAYYKLKIMEEYGLLKKDRLYIIEKSHLTTSGLERVADYFRKKGYHIYVVDTYIGFTEIGKKNRDLFDVAKRAWELKRAIEENADLRQPWYGLRKEYKVVKEHVPYETAGVKIIDEAIEDVEEFYRGPSPELRNKCLEKLNIIAHMETLMGLEESNGYSELGYYNPEEDRVEDAHIADKDGSLAAYEFLELLSYGKAILGKSGYQMYTDMLKELGWSATDNQFLLYPGFAGKGQRFGSINAIEKILAAAIQKMLDENEGKQEDERQLPVLFDKYRVSGVTIYRDEKYDDIYLGFPEEGVRFNLITPSGSVGSTSYRPSGTGNVNRDYNWIEAEKPGEGEDIEVYRKRVNQELTAMVETFFGEPGDTKGLHRPDEKYPRLQVALRNVVDSEQKVIELFKKAMGIKMEEEVFTQAEEELYQAVKNYIKRPKDEGVISANTSAWAKYLATEEARSYPKMVDFYLNSKRIQIPNAFAKAWQASLVGYLSTLVKKERMTRVSVACDDLQIDEYVAERTPEVKVKVVPVPERWIPYVEYVRPEETIEAVMKNLAKRRPDIPAERVEAIIRAHYHPEPRAIDESKREERLGEQVIVVDELDKEYHKRPVRTVLVHNPYEVEGKSPEGATNITEVMATVEDVPGAIGREGTSIGKFKGYIIPDAHWAYDVGMIDKKEHVILIFEIEKEERGGGRFTDLAPIIEHYKKEGARVFTKRMDARGRVSLYEEAPGETLAPKSSSAGNEAGWWNIDSVPQEISDMARQLLYEDPRIGKVRQAISSCNASSVRLDTLANDTGISVEEVYAVMVRINSSWEQIGKFMFIGPAEPHPTRIEMPHARFSPHPRSEEKRRVGKALNKSVERLPLAVDILKAETNLTLAGIADALDLMSGDRSWPPGKFYIDDQNRVDYTPKTSSAGRDSVSDITGLRESVLSFRKSVDAGMVEPSPVILSDNPQPRLFVKGDEMVYYSEEILKKLHRAVRIARKFNIEMEINIRKEDCIATDADFPEEENIAVIISELPEEVQMNTTEYFTLAAACVGGLWNVCQNLFSQKDTGLSVNITYYPPFQRLLTQLATHMRENLERISIYSHKENKRITLYPDDLLRLTSLDTPMKDTLEFAENINKIEAVACKWVGMHFTNNYDFKFEEGGIYNVTERACTISKDIISIHNHPKGYPSPPSYINDGRKEWGDIVSKGFFGGITSGLVLDTPSGEELFLLNEPDARNKDVYIEMFRKFWRRRLDIREDLRQVAMRSYSAAKSSSAGELLNLADIESLTPEALDKAIASATGVLEDVLSHSKVAAEVSRFGEAGTIVINDESIPPSQRDVVFTIYKEDSPALKELERLTGCTIRLRSQLRDEDIRPNLIIISDAEIKGYEDARYLMINDIPKKTDGYLPIAPLVGIAKALLGLKDKEQVNSSLKELYRNLCKKPLTDEVIQQYLNNKRFYIELPKPEAYDYQKLEMLQRQALAALIAA